MATTHPLKLYRHPLSGHSHRAQLVLSLMGVPHERVDVDLRKGANEAPGFLKRPGAHGRNRQARDP